jgi:pyruvate/2-oxoglutarate dehydrogenase complex dihydrolipoamide dehydrogenase (E3) component
MTHLSPIDEFDQKLISYTHPPEWQNSTPAPVYNLVVIGAGSAGLVATAGAAGLGAKVAIIEKNMLGGDCLNVGCVPSKTVIRSAKVLGELKRAPTLGVTIGSAQVDFAAVMRRMRQVRADIAPHDSAQRFTNLGADVFFGEAQFVTPHTLRVNGAELRFKKAIIATGSRPMILPIPGLQECGFLTNETLFQLTTRPARLAIIGAGPIGCEMAQTFARFGSCVSVFDIANRILPREEPNAAALAAQSLVNDGVQLAVGANITQICRDEKGKTLHYEQNGQQHTLVVDEILLTVGRSPNVEGLGLENIGVVFGKGGVTVNDYLQTTQPHIFAVGDVALASKFTHVADFSARIALQNALFAPLGIGRRKFSQLTIPWCIYTDPEIAHVGLNEAEAHQQGTATEIFCVPMENVDRARTDNATDGFIRVLVRKGTDTILGATIVGHNAGELICEFTLAMTNKLGLKAIAATIHPYPTYSEGVRKSADAWNRTRLTPLVKQLFSRWLAFSR